MNRSSSYSPWFTAPQSSTNYHTTGGFTSTIMSTNLPDHQEPGKWAEKISDLKGDLANKEALDKQARKDLKKSPNDPAANRVRVDVQRFKDESDPRMRYYEAMKNLEEATEDKKTSVEDLKKFGEAADLAKKSWESYEAVNKEKEKGGADDCKEQV